MNDQLISIDNGESFFWYRVKIKKADKKNIIILMKGKKMIGKINEEILEALLDAIPIEFSIVDKNDKVIAWNKHETRIFKRPKGVIGKDVQNCHPQKSLHMVEKILDEMKQGKRDKARFWIDLSLEPDKEKQKILIEYFAIKDSKGNYLGCLEASQNITEIQKLTGQKRLLD